MNAMLLIAIHGIYVVGAITFLVFHFDRSRRRASWARWLGLVVALLVMVLAVSGFALDFHMSLPIASSISWPTMSFIRGIALGLLVALIASGEVGGKKIER